MVRKKNSYASEAQADVKQDDETSGFGLHSEP